MGVPLTFLLQMGIQISKPLPLRAHSCHLAKTLLRMEAILSFSIDTVISLFCSFGNFYRDLSSTKWVSSNHLGAGV